MTKQIETATIVGTIINPGNAKVTVTALHLTNSPKIFAVPVLALDTAAQVAAKSQAVIAVDADIQAFFTVSGTGANIVLTARVDAANDLTYNIASDNDTCTGLTQELTSVHTLAGAGNIVNGYCTLDEVKSSDVLHTPAAATDDDFICNIITSVSRGIDRETSRYFYKSAAHEVRYFTAVDPDRLFTGDIVSVTNLYTDTLSGDRTYPFTWATTDYDLWPWDAATNSEPEPYRFIEVAPRGMYKFPTTYHLSFMNGGPGVHKGVKLDAVFGWPEVPQQIQRACILWSARIFMRYAAPLGITSVSALGQTSVKVPPPDPDVASMINNYRMPAI